MDISYAMASAIGKKMRCEIWHVSSLSLAQGLDFYFYIPKSIDKNLKFKKGSIDRRGRQGRRRGEWIASFCLMATK
jgi:hypothetical protein